MNETRKQRDREYNKAFTTTEFHEEIKAGFPLATFSYEATILLYFSKKVANQSDLRKSRFVRKKTLVENRLKRQERENWAVWTVFLMNNLKHETA